ncbi:hypothetical protein ACOSQ2_003593 [Xanthoceras sorbifolium]
MPYRLDESTGLVDYEMLEKTHYCWCQCLSIPSHEEDCRCCWCFSMMDMAHISGLVAAFVVGDPFKYCDIVTTTPHKSLRGPRGGMIFFKKDPVSFTSTIFRNYILSFGFFFFDLKHAQSPEFKNYQEKVVSNCRALAKPID